MSYIRKSFEERSGGCLMQEDRGLAYTASYAHPPKSDYNARPRYGGSNQKKYDYQSEINESREGSGQARARTPSAGEYNKYKYDSNLLSATEQELQTGVSHGKLKRIAKNYASGIGNTNFAQFSTNPNPTPTQKSKNKYINIKDDGLDLQVERKQNVNTRNYEQPQQGNNQRFQFTAKQYQKERERESKDRSYSKKYNEQQAIKDSFQRANQEKILQKIGRINKLNIEINDRLQKILAKVNVQ